MYTRTTQCAVSTLGNFLLKLLTVQISYKYTPYEYSTVHVSSILYIHHLQYRSPLHIPLTIQKRSPLHIPLTVQISSAYTTYSTGLLYMYHLQYSTVPVSSTCTTYSTVQYRYPLHIPLPVQVNNFGISLANTRMPVPIYVNNLQVTMYEYSSSHIFLKPYTFFFVLLCFQLFS